MVGNCRIGFAGFGRCGTQLHGQSFFQYPQFGWILPLSSGFRLPQKPASVQLLFQVFIAALSSG
jgi:hypothetical protein